MKSTIAITNVMAATSIARSIARLPALNPNLKHGVLFLPKQ